MCLPLSNVCCLLPPNFCRRPQPKSTSNKFSTTNKFDTFTNSGQLVATSLYEMVGMMLYVIVTALAVSNFGQAPGYCALVIGMAISILTFNGIGFSGGHFNPIVTLSIAISDPGFGCTRMICYVLAQFLGAIIGGMIILDVVVGEQLIPMVLGDQPVAMLCEAIFTFLLVVVVLRTTAKHDMYGFNIGGVYFVGMAVCHKISFGLFNPAVAMGLYLGSAAVEKIHENDAMWIWFFGPFIGAMFAVLFNSIITAMQGSKGTGYTTAEETGAEEMYNREMYNMPTVGGEADQDEIIPLPAIADTQQRKYSQGSGQQGGQTPGFGQSSGAVQQGAQVGGIAVGAEVMQDMRRSMGSGQETRSSGAGVAVGGVGGVAVGDNVVQDMRYSVGSGSPQKHFSQASTTGEQFSQENAAYSQGAMGQSAVGGANMSWVQSSVGAQMSGGQMDGGYNQGYQYNAAYSPQQNTAPMYNEEVQYTY